MATTAHILIVEDDPLLTKLLAFVLADAGYRTTALADSAAALHLLADETIHLALLDIGLPGVDGLALCSAIRHAHPDLPVIFLSGRAVLADKVAGFNSGADDYLAKPFEPQELLARIRAVLRRHQRAERNVYGLTIRVGDAVLDLQELGFTVPGRESVVLTPTEMKILECLMRNANAVIARETLIERTWGYDYEGTDNRVPVYIRRLRKKVEADPGNPIYLHTVRDVGYTFRPGRAAARPALHLLDAGRGDAGDNGRVREWSAIGD